MILYFLMLTLLHCDSFASRGITNKRKKKDVQKTAQKQQPIASKSPFNYGLRTHLDTDTVQPTAMPTFRPQDLNFKKTVLDNPLLPPEQSTELSKTTTPLVIPPLPPCPPEETEEENIEFNFENADLQNLIQQIQDIFEVTFISADAIKPPAQGQKEIKGNKISFKTHRPLTKQEAWNLFVTFLDTAGFAVIPHPDPKIYRIVTTGPATLKSPLPTFIGVDYKTLPDTDDVIRYVYFLENTTTDTIEAIIKPLISNQSGIIMLKEHKGFILIDKAYNIKMLMTIIKELDKVTVPEAMTVLKLRNANAQDVAKLYETLIPKEDHSRFFPKKQSSLYFPENTRIIFEPRTNALILLGAKDAINKIENFITKYIDVEIDQAYSPLYTYQLKYAKARAIAEIMTNVTNEFNSKNQEKVPYGGVRGVDQYMQNISFTAEEQTNRIIIKAHYEDYLKAKEILDQLDEEQPQVAIEVLIVTVDLVDTKSLGSQLRSKQPGPNGLLGNNIKFQTSGFFGQGVQTIPDTTTIPTSGVDRLLGNLINLVTGTPVGSSILTLGQDAFGVWGILEALQSITDTEIVANPFLIATNNTPAFVELGQVRRGVNAEVVGASETVNGFGSFPALLSVKVKPKINSDGMIVLDLDVELDNFTDNINFNDVTKNQRNVTTTVTVADKEVIALGGLIQDNFNDVVTKVPILGDIPILGWFFKNKQTVIEKQSLLILVSAQIIGTQNHDAMAEFTDYHTNEYQSDIDSMRFVTDNRDPVYRAFFQDKEERARKTFEGFLFERQERTREREQAALEKENQHKQKIEDSLTASNNENEPPQETRENISQKTSNDGLIKTIHNKKRTQLSLSEFLSNPEERS